MNILLLATTMKNNRPLKHTALEINNYNVNDLPEYIKKICYALDLETPVLLSKHFRYIESYNIVKFNKYDFIDSINFDSLIIERSEK